MRRINSRSLSATAIMTLLILSLGISSCGLIPKKYDGRIYNSNDGSCEYAGESIDFYVDGDFVATVSAGSNYKHSLKKGEHVFEARLSSDDTVLDPGYTLDIKGDGWWYRYGCNDGTYPSSFTQQDLLKAAGGVGQSGEGY